MSKELTKTDTVTELQAAVETEKQKREVMKSYVQSQLVEGVDYGKIPMGSGRESKPCLFKPGMEKILSLMGIQSVLEKDTDTWEMAGSKPGLICYRCTLSKNSLVLAEGRGAALNGEKSRDINSTIKIAEKRARMDAVLSLGFSEYFTQDLDDMPAKDDSEQKQDTIDLPDGTYTVLVVDERHGEKNGRVWQRVSTGDGAAWNNTNIEMQIGDEYDVEVRKGSIVSAFPYQEPINPEGINPFDDIEVPDAEPF